MKSECSYVPIRKTGKFSPIVCDYIDQDPFLKPFYEAAPTLENFAGFIERKSQEACNRNLLVDVLKEQYLAAGIFDESVSNSIDRLRSNACFTITTGQQIGILLGPLYTTLKIISAVRMAEELRKTYTNHDFIPVFWMATEDHDVEEINHVSVLGKNVRWNTDQKGPVGRFSNAGMEKVLEELKELSGKSADANWLMEIYTKAYALPTLSLATRYLVHAILGDLGVLILDADDKRLKQDFAVMMAKDIVEKNSFRAIENTRSKIEERYKTQVKGREINFFYMLDGYRERIIEEEGTFKTHDAKHTWNTYELTTEITEFPERFSPNVVMRPLYQETILPNIAYIGGGAEISYWLEFADIFKHYQIPYPALILRQSAMVIDKVNSLRIQKLGLESSDLFLDFHVLEKKITLSLSEHDLELQAERKQLHEITERLNKIALDIDFSLSQSTESLNKRIENQLERFSKKLIRAQKKKLLVEIERLKSIWEKIYPIGTLQERKESIHTLIVLHSNSITMDLHTQSNPFQGQFLIIQKSV
jgi:bacillithiol biosynthesis cysteine-adding enzyme BshC